jgi:dihydroorotase
MVPLLANAVHQEKLDWVDIERLCSRNPQHIFGFELQGCATIIDPRFRWRVQNELLHTKCKWSPFHGRVLNGSIETTIVNGTVVFEKGMVLENNRGIGKIVERK